MDFLYPLIFLLPLELRHYHPELALNIMLYLQRNLIPIIDKGCWTQ